MRRLESAASAARAAEAIRCRPFAVLQVLDAQRTVLAAEDKEAASAGSVTSNLSRVYETLGGGWTPIDDLLPSDRSG